jgi:pectate lyase
MALSRGTAFWIHRFCSLPVVQAAAKRESWSSARGGMVVLLAFVVATACETGVFDIDVGVTPASIELDIVDIDLISGGTAVIQAKVEDAKGKPVNVGPGGVRIEWSSSEDWIASVTPLGQATARVTGGAAGTAEITAAVHPTVAQAGLLALLQGSSNRGGIRASSTVNVRPADLIAVAGDGQTGTVGSTLSGELIVQAVDESGKGVPNVDIRFVARQHHGTLEPASVVTDAAGLARSRWTLGEAAGEMKAEAGAHNRFKLTPVEFTASALDDEVEQLAASVTVSPASATLAKGSSRQFSATVKDANGATISEPSLTWTSSNPGVASVNASGVVNAHEAGTATVTATSNNVSGTASVTVEAPAAPPPPTGGLLPAFPGAEGWGATALNECRSRPLQVLFVDNTNPEGTGSIDQALRDARSDRYTFILFRTGGRIKAPGGDNLRITTSCVYIAGQTAPGDGAVIDGSGEHRSMWIRGSDSITDVVIRFLRFRDARTNLSIRRGERIVLDHLSFSWATRYVLQFSRTTASSSGPISDVSVQNLIISEVFADHPTAFVIGSGSDLKADDELGLRNLSIHGNLLANNVRRNPMIAADNALVANNVIYNWRDGAAMMNRRGVVDWVGNVGKAGPMTDSRYLELITPYCNELGGDFSIYMTGNIGPLSADPNGDNWVGPTRQIACYRGSGDYTGEELASMWRRNTPQNWGAIPYPVSIAAAPAVLGSVLDNAGAKARLACDGSWVAARDPVDSRVIRNAADRTGPTSAPANVSEAGGWPTYRVGNACVDTDGDGLPDAWEQRFFGCATCADPQAVGRNGYLVIEHYLNGTTP